MKCAEDDKAGLMAIDPSGDGGNILRFGRTKYDGSLRVYRPDCAINLADFATWPTKRKATGAAKLIGFTADHVDRIGSRFCQVWGIRHDLRDTYFLVDQQERGKMAESLTRRAALTKAWHRQCSTTSILPDTRYESGFVEGFHAAWEALLSEIGPLVAELHTKPFFHDDHTSRHNHSVERLRELVREGGG